MATPAHTTCGEQTHPLRAIKPSLPHIQPWKLHQWQFPSGQSPFPALLQEFSHSVITQDVAGGAAASGGMGMDTHLLQDGVGHGGVGMHDDGGCLVISDLLQERGGIPAVIQHPHRQRVLGNEELPQQLLQV